ncbi:hypothetical protein PILCRDRAFT_810983 [Piloderma croceum F 1598]|uniref:Uncharacterized protein n=1 Tax=Piloderma croceum (strain F 1598) TaxID=765440 RepID=A0A0C3GMG7_PILCF|nr:hypothetical protein PILCRDRAFT_810983 [Piloderma croceum F 1598]
MKDKPAAQTRALRCPNTSSYDTILKWSRKAHDHDFRIDSEDLWICRHRKRDQMVCRVRHLAGRYLSCSLSSPIMFLKFQVGINVDSLYAIHASPSNILNDGLAVIPGLQIG